MWSFWKGRKKPKDGPEPVQQDTAAQEEDVEKTQLLEEQTVLLPQVYANALEPDVTGFCVEQDITLLASPARLRS